MTIDPPRWKLTEFASALLEHDGETCNEIFCTSRDEAECLVDLLNEWTERAEKAEAEVERLRGQLIRAVEMAEKIWADCSNGSEHTELAALKSEIK